MPRKPLICPRIVLPSACRQADSFAALYALTVTQSVAEAKARARTCPGFLKLLRAVLAQADSATAAAKACGAGMESERVLQLRARCTEIARAVWHRSSLPSLAEAPPAVTHPLATASSAQSAPIPGATLATPSPPLGLAPLPSARSLPYRRSRVSIGDVAVAAFAAAQAESPAGRLPGGGSGDVAASPATVQASGHTHPRGEESRAAHQLLHSKASASQRWALAAEAARTAAAAPDSGVASAEGSDAAAASATAGGSPSLNVGILRRRRSSVGGGTDWAPLSPPLLEVTDGNDAGNAADTQRTRAPGTNRFAAALSGVFSRSRLSFGRSNAVTPQQQQLLPTAVSHPPPSSPSRSSRTGASPAFRGRTRGLNSSLESSPRLPARASAPEEYLRGATMETVELVSVVDVLIQAEETGTVRRRTSVSSAADLPAEVRRTGNTCGGPPQGGGVTPVPPRGPAPAASTASSGRPRRFSTTSVPSLGRVNGPGAEER